MANQDRYEYRLTFDGTSVIHRTYPNLAWDQAVLYADQHGVEALLERRLVTDASILEFFNGDLPNGWIRLREMVITSWENFAHIRAEHVCIGGIVCAGSSL